MRNNEKALSSVGTKITTLDIEASDIHPQSYPIEIGVSLPSGNGYCSLIKPPPEWSHWSDEAEAVHGISRQEICEHGKSVSEVAHALNRYLNGKTVYSDCWVLDQPWMIRLFQAAKLEPDFILRDVMYCLSESEYAQLGEIKSAIESELNIERHRATNDARILQLAVERIVSQRSLID